MHIQSVLGSPTFTRTNLQAVKFDTTLKAILELKMFRLPLKDTFNSVVYRRILPTLEQTSNWSIPDATEGVELEWLEITAAKGQVLKAESTVKSLFLSAKVIFGGHGSAPKLRKLINVD